MFVATLVDATDGVLARRARVKEVLPAVDGARIDDIVDYLTFVFLPMLLLEAAGGLYASAVDPVAAIVLLSSMYGFVAPDAKTSDHFFTGFPSVLEHRGAVSAAVPRAAGRERPDPARAERAHFRADRLRLSVAHADSWMPVTLTLGGLWTAAIGAIIWLWPSPPALARDRLAGVSRLLRRALARAALPARPASL